MIQIRVIDAIDEVQPRKLMRNFIRDTREHVYIDSIHNSRYLIMPIYAQITQEKRYNAKTKFVNSMYRNTISIIADFPHSK